MQNESSTHLAHAGGNFSRIRRRVIVYGSTLTVLALLQTTLLPAFALLDITPDLCLLLVLGAARFDGAESGGAVGIAAGFLESALGGIGSSLLPLLFFAIGYGTGYLAGRALARTFPSYLIFAAVLCFLRPAITLAALSLRAHTASFDLTVIFRNTLVPEFLVNLIASAPMYPLIRQVDRWIRIKSER